MNESRDSALTQSLQSVKELFTEFFLLQDQSLQSDPFSPESVALDVLIEQLMSAIDQSSGRFRRDLNQAREKQAISSDLNAAVNEFDEQLRGGLELMAQRIHRRADELRCQREELKARLGLVRRKQRGAHGYHDHVQPSQLLESKI